MPHDNIVALALIFAEARIDVAITASPRRVTIIGMIDFILVKLLILIQSFWGFSGYGRHLGDKAPNPNGII